MNSQPAAGLSRYLALGFVPLCAWGMLSALLLHLIAVRSVFIQGGDDRLRLAVLAFAGGVVFLQRLMATQGGEHAEVYKWALILTMALFTISHSMSYRLPIHPMLVILANGIIFAVLYWVGMKITSACAVDSDDKSAVASEIGVFSRARRLRTDHDTLPQDAPRNKRATAGRAGRKLAEQPVLPTWQEKLAPQHPGRILFYFSIFAIPAFGLGGLLLDPSHGGISLLGMNLFLYLFCALSLLFLSSFGQLSAYFEQREVALPEVIGVTWLSLGFVCVILVILMAFLFPQPPSAAGGFVRDRIVARYEGFKSNSGVREQGVSDQQSPGKGSGGGAQPTGAQKAGSGSAGQQNGNTEGGGRKIAEARAQAQMEKDAEVDKVIPKVDDRRMQGAQEGVQKIFDFLLKALGVLALIAGVIVAIVVVMAIWGGIGARSVKLRNLFPKRAKEKKEQGPEKSKRRSEKFGSFPDPATAGVTGNADDLVHYLWDATLARCADAGEECTPDQTPYEFLRTEPATLQKIQHDAQILAGWLLHAEYSGQPVPSSAVPELMRYWSQLKAL